MFEAEKSKIRQLGLIILIYSLFLICQGFWLSTHYYEFYPGVFNSIDYEFCAAQGLFPMMNFTQTLVLITPILGGLILMGIGLWITTKGEKSKFLWYALIVLIYSFILLFQTIWILFIYPKFASAEYWNLTGGSSSISTFWLTLPRIVWTLEAIIPPMLGSIIFFISGLYLVKKRLKTQKLVFPLILKS